jgi:hypothetical protein
MMVRIRFARCFGAQDRHLSGVVRALFRVFCGIVIFNALLDILRRAKTATKIKGRLREKS